jgi:NADH-quinone oxidoreductase subunit L
MPLHTWLPDSMAGPLPVSALIHAATMVTAGIFMIARVMPLFAHSAMALDLMLIIGSITCIAMGLVAIVQYDVKQVLAYSTISQLGLMLVALGASSAYAAISHLVTHAFFKALLFLNAGIVIKACNDKQDLREMGGLHAHMPFNYWIMLFASLAAIGVPGLSGFYSKELILAAINVPKIYNLALFSIFITTVYTLRMFFLIFYGTDCAQVINHKQATKSWLVKVPLIVLVIPVIILGWLSEEAWNKMLHGFISLPFLIIVLGSMITWLCYDKYPRLAAIFAKIFIPINFILINKYWFEKINTGVVYIGKQIGNGCFQLIDRFIIENVIINGSVKCINKFSNTIRMIQTGYLYHYLLIMLIGLILLLYILLLGKYGYY